VRWDHPERGLLLPDAFIPLARQSALVRPITRYVLDIALEQCRAWQDLGIDVGVAVNLAGRDLGDARLEEEVFDALRRWQIEPSLLELEIPETAIVTDRERERVHQMLARLSEGGVRIAVDDFGSGYASISHLKQLPVDVLKIDESFVHNVGKDDADDAIVCSTIELSHRLGITVVAEGVESEDVLERLRALGCDFAQGFCLAPPAPADDVTEWLLGRKSAAA
jgi:EAL domain-containing protein (putative c-di-GMP-specific phosphodiesterase class I)